MNWSSDCVRRRAMPNSFLGGSVRTGMGTGTNMRKFPEPQRASISTLGPASTPAASDLFEVAFGLVWRLVGERVEARGPDDAQLSDGRILRRGWV